MSTSPVAADGAPERARLVGARVRVPGSTSNLGVGFDCVGLACDRYLTARFEPGDPPFRLRRSGELAELADEDEDLLGRAFLEALERSGVREPGGVISADSDIPLRRGLGSSGAAIVAGLLLAGAAAGSPVGQAQAGDGHAPAPAGDPLPPELRTLLADAVALEGHPDNVAPALLGGLVAVATGPAGRLSTVRLPLADAVGFAFAAPGSSVSTAVARGALPRRVPHRVAARAVGRLAALLRGLADADPELLRVGFADEPHVPSRLPLIPGGERALDAALEAGAWAVTVSGSGSGLIAVCDACSASPIATAMADAFARADDGRAIGFVLRPDRAGARVLGPAHEPELQT